jgi:TetR/AcrR family transcriptional regulator, regulator of cefoperazone and chloramphenicol sensitivity
LTTVNRRARQELQSWHLPELVRSRRNCGSFSNNYLKLGYKRSRLFMPSVQHAREVHDDTRARILQAAGPIFAEYGYRAATIKQITDAAKANVAAVNYHFGDKSKLYLEVLRRALPDPGGPIFCTQPGYCPREQLRIFISNYLAFMLGEDHPKWHGQVLARELESPTEALPKLVEENLRPCTMHLENVVREIYVRQPDQEQIRLVAHSIIALSIYWVKHRDFLSYVWPGLTMTDAQVESIGNHVYEFALRGLTIYEKSKLSTKVFSKAGCNPRGKRRATASRR